MFDFKSLRTMIGTTTPCGIDINLNLFENIYDTGEDVVFQTTKVYEHIEEGLNFKYRYLIKVTRVNDDFTNDDPINSDIFGAYVYLVLMPDSLNELTRTNICEFCGIEYDKLECADIIEYGCGVLVAWTNGMLVTDAETNFFDYEEVSRLVNLVSNVVEHIDMMRGFCLDAPYNALGNTGWDTIKDIKVE
jgi:hypothetical protein